MSMYSLKLYPGSTYAYCPSCKMTCQPKEFIGSDLQLQLVCPRCVAHVPQIDAEPEDDEEEADEQWVQMMMGDGKLGRIEGLNLCATEGCKMHTVHSCRMCGKPCCIPHQGEDDMCGDCDQFNREYGPYFSPIAGTSH